MNIQLTIKLSSLEPYYKEIKTLENSNQYSIIYDQHLYTITLINNQTKQVLPLYGAIGKYYLLPNKSLSIGLEYDKLLKLCKKIINKQNKVS